jgi:hypothetical protein
MRAVRRRVLQIHSRGSRIQPPHFAQNLKPNQKGRGRGNARSEGGAQVPLTSSCLGSAVEAAAEAAAAAKGGDEQEMGVWISRVGLVRKTGNWALLRGNCI